MAQKNKNKEENNILESGKPNWPVLIPIIVVFVVLLVLVFFL